MRPVASHGLQRKLPSRSSDLLLSCSCSFIPIARGYARFARPNLIFSQLYSSYQIVTASRVWHLSASSLCSVIAVDVCVTEALEPRFFCHLLISDSNSPISLLPST